MIRTVTVGGMGLSFISINKVSGGNNKKPNSQFETATFGAGCFWGVEEAFRTLPGVVSTEVGYMGGHADNPTYEKVSTDTTGHAEVVQIKYEPHTISYSDLLTKFWNAHDPTTPNRQGPDVGSQYRSLILFHTPEQEKLAREKKKEMEKSGGFDRAIVTEIAPAGVFYRAEDYHQKYLMKRGLATCHI